MAENTKSPANKPVPTNTPQPAPQKMVGSAPSGGPRHANLPDGNNHVPDDAKGYNPGSVVTG